MFDEVPQVVVRTIHLIFGITSFFQSCLGFILSFLSLGLSICHLNKTIKTTQDSEKTLNTFWRMWSNKRNWQLWSYSENALIMLVIAHNKVCLYLLKKLLHYSHSFIQLVFCMLGSIQGIVGHCNGSIAIQTTTVAFAFIITTTSTATRTVHTWSVTRCSTYLQKQ